MSAFDDEFGLFGETEGEDERRSTLGARRISEGEAVLDEIEPEDEPSPRRRRVGTTTIPPTRREGGQDDRRPPSHRRGVATSRTPLADEVLYPRATELLTFLAKGLVSKPEAVAIELRVNDRGGVLALEVHPDDLGKSDRSWWACCASAGRTLVRAGAEGRMTVDIVDVDRLARASMIPSRRRATSRYRSNPTTTDAPLIALGRLTRVVGLRGEIECRLGRSDGEMLAPGVHCRLGSGADAPSHRIAAVRRHRERTILRFRRASHDRGGETVRRSGSSSFRPPDRSPREDEFFDDELIGMGVYDIGGELHGTVVRVEHYPAQDCIVVDPGARLVPMVRAIVRSIDREQRRIVVDPPAGLLDGQPL